MPERPIDSTATIARLQAELAQAQKRAVIAEQQLARVYESIRAHKARQMQIYQEQAAVARQEAQAAAAAATAPQQEAPAAEPSWPVVDPTLDERFEEYLDSALQPDKARRWMLGS